MRIRKIVGVIKHEIIKYVDDRLIYYLLIEYDVVCLITSMNYTKLK